MHKLSRLLLHHSIQACKITVENKHLKFPVTEYIQNFLISNEGGLRRTFKALFVTVSKALHAGFLCLL